MKRIFTFIIILLIGKFVSAQDNCHKYTDGYVPVNLEDALNYLDCVVSDSLKTEFKNRTKSELVRYGGMGMRNGWGFWKGKNKISKYFHGLGIYHPDDMSAIITESFHRKLNNEPILLNEQIEYYVTYWEEDMRSEKIIWDSLNLIFEEKFNNLNKGDTIQIQFNLYKGSGDRIQQYPIYEEECNCLIEGIIKNKRFRKKKYFRGRYELHIRLIKTCGLDEIIFRMEDTELKKGKTYKFFNLDDYRISKK